MRSRPFDPKTVTSVEGCKTCAWAIEHAKKLVREGKRGVTVTYPDGRSRHISGFGYDVTERGDRVK